jgi:hypothetical protein
MKTTPQRRRQYGSSAIGGVELTIDMSKANRVSNEKKNLNRLAGEFLVASRLTQRGYMVTLQWGTAIGYDTLAFDKQGKVAFIEVKSTASYPRRWVLQSKYANPRADAIPQERRFVCCVDISSGEQEPSVHVFPASVVASGLHYYFNSKFPQSAKQDVKTVGQFIHEEEYLENYNSLGLIAVTA